ncbi:nucleoprotein [Aedes alboannulatus orthomyxo-like virus]|nr:nucleoprotein [Aedes alboannulatus orthomyxo-like virus]
MPAEVPKATPIAGATDVEMPDEEAAGSSAAVIPVPVTQTKRKNVDDSGVEVPDSKRNRAVPKSTIKMNVFKLIMHWHEYLSKVFGLTSRSNIDQIADLTSICSTLHTKFRQDLNGVGTLRDRINDDFKFTAVGKEITYGAIKDTMKALATLYGFKYIATDEDREAIGTLSSVMVLMSAYRQRFNEVRLGNTSITLKKKDGTEYEMELSRFGLNNTHSTLLHGCRFTPSLQSSMKQSLGPLTIVINLCMNQDRKYQEAWKSAFCQAYKLLPYVTNIAEILAGSKTRHQAIIRQLGDVGLFGITRTSNKAFLPVALLLTYMEKKSPAYVEKFKAFSLTLEAIPDVYLTPNIKNLDFSGHGLLHFWNSCAAYAFQIHGDPAVLIGATASQMVFHAVMGTHKENLNLLKWMTGTEFATRRALGDVFKARASSGKETKVAIISFNSFAKMASAAQTDFLKGGVGQVARVATFSGKFSTALSQDDELFRILRDTVGDRGRVMAINDDTVIKTLDAVKETINNRLIQEKKMSYGTTEFYAPLNGGDGSKYGNLVEGPGSVPPRFFYQQE